MGQINAINVNADHKEPDIAATQDYMNPETHFFQIVYVKIVTAVPTYTIESSYIRGGGPTPWAAAYIATAPVYAPANIVNRPTVASKVTIIFPTFFDTYFAWEDYSDVNGNPDIWYRVGQHALGAGWAFLIPALRVPYVPIGVGDTEQNPEFWNRNEATRILPPFTHLVFDRDPDPVGGMIEVEYIDP